MGEVAARAASTAPKVAATWPSSTSTWRSTSDSSSDRPKASDPPSQAALTQLGGTQGLPQHLDDLLAPHRTLPRDQVRATAKEQP